MNYDLETAMTDLHSPVSFGGGGQGEGGSRDRQERRNSFHQRRNAGRNESNGSSWGGRFKRCLKEDDTWHGSDTPATDSFIGCAGRATFESER